MVVAVRLAFVGPFIAFALGVCGCKPSIGDPCNLSNDCSVRGDRVCDSAQPLGYCTIRNCGGNSCPESAACVLFNAAPAGCPYDDRAPGRTARSFCMAACEVDKDCRDGYICADAKGNPWRALILDDDQAKKVCIPSSKQASSPSGSAPPVCNAAGPVVPALDAAAPWAPAEAGAADAANDAGADVVMGATTDAASADGAGIDAGVLDAGVLDAAADATVDGPGDAAVGDAG